MISVVMPFYEKQKEFPQTWDALESQLKEEDGEQGVHQKLKGVDSPK